MSDNTTSTSLNRTAIQTKTNQIISKIIKNAVNFNYKQFYKNKYLLFSSLVVIILVGILLLTGVSSVDPQIPTYKVKRDNFLVTITESGEIRAKNSVPVNAPRIRGNLKIIYMIPEGTTVKPGEMLMKFDPIEALTAVKDAKSQLDIAMSEKKKLQANHESNMAKMESSLKSAEISFELSKLKLEQIKYEAEAKQQEQKLQYQQDEISYNRTKKEYESMLLIQQSEMAKMNVEIEQKRGELERAQRELDELTVTAPAPGLVVYSVNWNNSGRKFAVGDSPWRGANIMSLPDLSDMESITNVNEVDVSKLKDGLETVVKLDAFQDTSFHGKVSQIASLGKKKERDSNIKVFEVIVAIEDTSVLLKPGMTTSNKIIINQVPDVLFVPHEAVFVKGEEQIVYVQNGSGFEERKVVLGIKSEDYVIVKSGLVKDEIVAMRDPNEEISPEDEQSTQSTLPNS